MSDYWEVAAEDRVDAPVQHAPGTADDDGLAPPPRPPATAEGAEEDRPVTGRAARSAGPWARHRFWLGLGAIALVGAALRLWRVLGDHRAAIGIDGVDFHLSALRLADGQGFVATLAGHDVPSAAHPPAWSLTLGAVSWLGGRSVETHQLVAAALGVLLVVLAGLVGRRYFNPRAGLAAALLVAVYPGFWLVEGDVLGEPLTLVVLAVAMLLVADLRDRPTLGRTALVGAVCGVLALTRSDALLYLVVVVVPVLAVARDLTVARRLGRIAVAAIVALVVIAPWAAYNTHRFHDPVALSTGDGVTLLAGNCPPGSYSGAGLGTSSQACLAAIIRAHPGMDPSQLNSRARHTALHNAREHVGRLPEVLAARLGRLTGVYHPGETVRIASASLSYGTGLLWAWTIAFWVAFALAIVGTVLAHRAGRPWWPLVAPFVVAVVVAAVSFGEARGHLVGDLGLLVLAGFALERLVARVERGATAKPPSRPSPPSGDRSRRARRETPKRLPSVYVR